MKTLNTTARGCIAAMFAFAFAASSAFADWIPTTRLFTENATTFAGKTAAGVTADGTWTATSDDSMTLDDLAYVDDGKIVVDAVEAANEKVVYTPTATLDATQFVITNHVCFSAAYSGMNGADASGKAGVLLAKVTEGEPGNEVEKTYFAYISEGVWNISDVEADPSQDYIVTFTFNATDGYVYYNLIEDGEPTGIGSAEYEGTISSVSITGAGTITSLSAAEEEDLYTLTFPAVLPTGVASYSVTVDGNPATPVGGIYYIPNGSALSVAFTPTTGYIIKGNPVEIASVEDDIDWSEGIDSIEVVEAEAQLGGLLGGTLYEFLTNALDVAEADSTIVMLKDVTADTVTVPASVKLDLNQQTLTASTIVNNGTIVVYDATTFYGLVTTVGGTYEFGAAVVVDDGEAEPTVLYSYPVGATYSFDTVSGAVAITVPTTGAAYVNNVGFDAGAKVFVSGPTALAGVIAGGDSENGASQVVISGDLTLGNITIGTGGSVEYPAVLTLVGENELTIENEAVITLVPGGVGKIVSDLALEDSQLGEFYLPEDYYVVNCDEVDEMFEYTVIDGTVAMIGVERYTSVADAVDAAEAALAVDPTSPVAINIVRDVEEDDTYPNGTTVTVSKNGTYTDVEISVPANEVFILGHDLAPDEQILVDGDAEAGLVELTAGGDRATVFAVTGDLDLYTASIGAAGLGAGDGEAVIRCEGTLTVGLGATVTIYPKGKVIAANQVGTSVFAAFDEGYEVVETQLLGGSYQYTVQVAQPSTVTLTIAQSDNIDSITVGGQPVGGTMSGLTPGSEITFVITAANLITVPLYTYYDGTATNTISSTATLTVPAADATWAFAVTEAASSDASDSEIMDAIEDTISDADAKTAIESLSDGTNAAEIAAWYKAGKEAGTISDAALKSAVDLDVSFGLGTTTLFSTEPVVAVSNFESVAASSSANVAYEMTFTVKNGAAGAAVTPADTEAVANYVKSLVKCATDLSFGSESLIEVEPTITISGSTISASVEIPKASGAQAFMKVAK